MQGLGADESSDPSWGEEDSGSEGSSESVGKKSNHKEAQGANPFWVGGGSSTSSNSSGGDGKSHRAGSPSPRLGRQGGQASSCDGIASANPPLPLHGSFTLLPAKCNSSPSSGGLKAPSPREQWKVEDPTSGSSF
ncbi:unnamed protein product, partial [Discosporangium mesarthrocarpum]